jgi:uncharacterized protein (TIGR02145 family)
MKNVIYLLFFVLPLSSLDTQGQFIISDAVSSRDSSAFMEVSSTDRGWLIPRMTTAQRDAISNPAAGLMIYNTDTGSIEFFNDNGWVNVNLAAAKNMPCGGKMLEHEGLIYGTVVHDDRCWMDRNLGASRVAESSTDALAFGYLYQWGRLNDGHQVVTSATTTTLANTPEPGHAMFILTSATPYDWLDPQDPNLWQSYSDFPNNPCPEGWKVPSLTEWNQAAETWSNIEDAYDSPLKLPGAGYRNREDGICYANGAGSYWTSTQVSSLSYRKYFSPTLATHYQNYRSWGYSVRCVEVSNTPVTYLFSKTYGGEEEDMAWALDMSPDGYFAIGGMSNSYGDGSDDLLLLKVDTTGNFQFGKVYDDDASEECTAIKVTSDNGFILTGDVNNNNAYTLKLNASGNVDWEERTAWGGNTRNRGVVEDAAGDLVFVGYTNAYGAGGYDLRLSKREADGTVVWGYATGTTSNEYGNALVCVSDGGYVTAGHSDGGTIGAYNFLLQKYDTDGIILWGKYIGGAGYDWCYAMALSHDQEYVMGGFTDSWGAGGYDYYVRKSDDNGDGWSVVVGGSGSDRAFAIARTPDNGFAVAGFTSSFGAGGTDIWLVKIDQDGNYMWSWAFGSAGSEDGRAVVVGNDGSIYVAGHCWTYPTVEEDVLLVKFAPDGGSCLGYYVGLPTDLGSMPFHMDDEFTATRVNTVSYLRVSDRVVSQDVRPRMAHDPDNGTVLRSTTVTTITPTVGTLCEGEY